MQNSKSIRDPIYGYIELEPDFARIVDTPEFQRLRNIRQTGYQALYPSALHNRFVHSLGVYHLGRRAIACFRENIDEMLPVSLRSEAVWAKIKRTFLAACLLHDVGHSPFSHSGEGYYTKTGFSFETAYQELLDIPSDIAEKACEPGSEESMKRQFYLDLTATQDGNTGKPHEAMSTLLGVELCRELKIDIDWDLFIRSIIGLKYMRDFSKKPPTGDLKKDPEVVVKNALIGLLNGDLIDVDKLDYVLRDSYVTGYNNMSIDLNRLLSGYTIHRGADGTYEPAFKKGALSVIENVIYANDLERRWIQTHPAILYDSWLVDQLLQNYDRYMCSQNPGVVSIYNKDALSKNDKLGLHPPLRLLCDDDIIAYVKNIDASDEGRQYFSRHLRFKPFWKTEAAFELLTEGAFGAKVLESIVRDFRTLLSSQGNEVGILIHPGLISQLKKDYNQLLPEDARAKSYHQLLHICSIFDTFAEDMEFPHHEFVLVLADAFQTSYRKSGIKEAKIIMNGEAIPLSRLLTVQAKGAEDAKKKTFFCVYTAPENVQDKGEINLGELFIDHLRRSY